MDKKYKLTKTQSVLRDDNACIPFDELNRDYREYLNWLDEGNQPLEADPEPEPTQEEIERQMEKGKADVSKESFKEMPNWATWTPDEGRQAVQANVLNGYDKAQLDAYIDTNVSNIASAKTALKLLGEAVIDLREIVGVMAQAILLLRDIVVRKYQLNFSSKFLLKQGLEESSPCFI